MGVKSKMRSMQRGAQVRDRGPADKTSDYANFDPKLTKGEELHFGVEGEQRDAFLRKINPAIESLVKAGFAKPVAISRELTRQKKRTFRGEFWSPRLCWFLKQELCEFRKRESRRVRAEQERERELAVRKEQQRRLSNPTNLTDAELQRRRLALQAFIKSVDAP